MAKLATVLLLIAALACTAQGQGARTHSSLKFKSQKPFRILQIADIHYQNGASTNCQDVLPTQLPCSDLNSTAWMAELLALENPDLVVFTGDNIWYPNNTNIIAAQRAVTKPVQDAKIPYMLTFGNHDTEEFSGREKLVADDNQNKYSLTCLGPKDIHGTVNYAYTINDASNKPKVALYVFDGGAYYKYGNDSRYDWIWPSQVSWYNKTSHDLEKSNSGKVVPGIAFFHIPLVQQDSAWTCDARNKDDSNPSYKDFGNRTTKSGMGNKLQKGCDGNSVGKRLEGVYSADVDGGLFSAFVERGDVRMTNVGHDHINDDCSSLYGIRMCYAGGFGYHAYNKAGNPRRARIIEVMPDGKVTTYKRCDKWSKPKPYATLDRETFSIAPKAS